MCIIDGQGYLQADEVEQAARWLCVREHFEVGKANCAVEAAARIATHLAPVRILGREQLCLTRAIYRGR